MVLTNCDELSRCTTNNKRFFFPTRRRGNFDQAQSFCARRGNGSQLASIVDAEELSIVRFLDFTGPDRDVWIGLRRPSASVSRTSSFKFIDGTEENAFYIRSSVTPWSFRQPDNRFRNEECVSMKFRQDRRWEDNPCSRLLFFLCKEPCVVPTPFPTESPSVSPTSFPTKNPSPHPTTNPTANPTTLPTNNPTLQPTKKPSLAPSLHPSAFPSVAPTESHLDNVTETPTVQVSSPSFGISVEKTIVFVLLGFITACTWCFAMGCVFCKQQAKEDRQENDEEAEKIAIGEL